MNKNLIYSLSLFLLWVSPFPANSSELNIWGTHFKFTAYQSHLNPSYARSFKKLCQTWETALDPDCLYRQNCQPLIKSSKLTQLTQLANEFAQQTKGHFNILKRKDGKRDFAGLSQGFMLQTWINQRPELSHFVADFGRDFYINSKSKQTLILSDPLLSALPLAYLKLKNGWVFSSYSHQTQSKDFDVFVLIGEQEMSGAQLDAWSTALMSGGKDLLEYLLKKHPKGWQYFYIDKKSQKLICSPLLKCQKTQADSLYQIEVSSL